MNGNTLKYQLFISLSLLTLIKIPMVAALASAARNLTGPAPTSCDAAYNAPCSRINSEWLAVETVSAISRRIGNGESQSRVFQDVSRGMYNMETGFYPFVFDRLTSVCVAHGHSPEWVGSTLEDVFGQMNIAFSDVQDLHSRFNDAAQVGGQWVQYMGRDSPEAGIQNKIAFVTNIDEQYYLGVGYVQAQLPLDLPCSNQLDSWCTINNIQSLAGKAQAKLEASVTLEQFETVLYDISFNSEFRAEGGFLLYLFHFEGPLVAHPRWNQYSGFDLGHIYSALGQDPKEGKNLHEKLVEAAEKESTWVQYPWRDHVFESPYTKIAFINKVKFMGENYYLGCEYAHVRGGVVPSNYEVELAQIEGRNFTSEEAPVCPGYNLPCSFGNTYQLASHTLSHLLSSSTSLDDTFSAITTDPQFNIEGWGYSFVTDFNGTNVAHAGFAHFVGLDIGDVFIAAGLTAEEGWEAHNDFRLAATNGGGFALYDWTTPGVSGSTFQKLSYVFRFTSGGRDYVGGVGMNHQRAPLHYHLDTGTRRNGAPIPCSSKYGSKCSELNSQAILGQALGDLVVASSETKVRNSEVERYDSVVQDVLASITAGSDLYRVNDFYVAVFAMDQSACYNADEIDPLRTQDDSGCCVAHGGDASFVGKTWQDILDIQGITSIRGRDLHTRLAGQIDRGGDWMQYSWAESSGGAKPKIAFSSRFRDEGKGFYVMVEYFAELPPPACSACPGDMECTQANQDFCVLKVYKPPFHKTPGFIIVMLVVIGVPCLGFLFCWLGKKGEERLAGEQIKHMDQKMQNMSKEMESHVKTASKANKLVASLFPQQVHDRIMQQIEEENSSEQGSIEENDAEDNIESIPAQNPWKRHNIENDSDSSRGRGSTEGSKGSGSKGSLSKSSGSAPICDLFPEATISFADICGFTAWSSTREPIQVFTLLETIYRRFDRLANRLGVFKVETVGDCYVAVCGLPEKREDHATVMARFATACLGEFKILVKDLEIRLGPGTGDLGLRHGLHSGPVTAGVLRGQRGRFQLFGDTVNTAARMESTGDPDRIHVSQELVTLLLEAGKSHWIAIREDKVVAKGKGVLNTYWLLPTAPDLLDTKLLTDSTTDSASSTSSGRAGESKPMVHPTPFVDKTQGLVEWNVNVMKGALAKVVAMRGAQNDDAVSRHAIGKVEKEFIDSCTSLGEVKETVTLPDFDSELATRAHFATDLSDSVIAELRAYIHTLASMYKNNPFHNFQHATHVTMSVAKLMSRIVTPEEVKRQGKAYAVTKAGLHDNTYGITSDPLTQFAVLLSALMHDVDHPGVPNTQLVAEGAKIATVYNQRSVAELNSLDLAWNLLMKDNFAELRAAIYSTESELRRFRQLMVNIVLATDIIDKDLSELRKERWNRAFCKKECLLVTDTGCDNDINRKATIVLEHLIQASDVAHTMQHWNVYIKWNERFFRECYDAYAAGRAAQNPTKTWYEGEIGFFDYYIIPLAKKLKECGVFGVSSAEYLRYAEQNRAEWKVRGQEIVEEYKSRLD